ncbi:MAG: ArnT family glycosyltransferase [Patescibacteria group bacterium]
MFKLSFFKRNFVEINSFLILIITSAFLRFPQLGYSHFYGDETKTLFLRKDISLKDFLLNQRKGPIQFLVSWGAENIFGNFDEAYIRLPYALAGFLAVIVFYFLVKTLFNFKVASISAFLFSFNGFFIAFSRTAQYQSFLLLFGFLSILFVLMYIKNYKYSRFWLFLSAVFLAFSYLAHYDALFYDFVVGLILLFYLLKNPNKLKEVVLLYVPVFLAIVSSFYIPYLLKGYFSDYTSNYLLRRVSGKDYATNSSLYTYLVYNPLYFSLVPLSFSVIAFVHKFDWRLKTVFLWFLLPFILFELVFSNPGTHILNYFPPLFILASVGMVTVIEVAFGYLKWGFVAFTITIFVLIFGVSYNVYLPLLNTGYPWKSTHVLGYKVDRIKKNDYHLFLYGFPYYRSWDKVSAYFEENGLPRSFYTDDNQTIGEYYIYGPPYYPLNPSQMPAHIVQVSFNQEFRLIPTEVLNSYVLEQQFVDNSGNPLATIYKQKKEEVTTNVTE